VCLLQRPQPLVNFPINFLYSLFTIGLVDPGKALSNAPAVEIPEPGFCQRPNKISVVKDYIHVNQRCTPIIVLDVLSYLR